MVEGADVLSPQLKNLCLVLVVLLLLSVVSLSSQMRTKNNAVQYLPMQRIDSQI